MMPKTDCWCGGTGNPHRIVEKDDTYTYHIVGMDFCDCDAGQKARELHEQKNIAVLVEKAGWIRLASGVPLRLEACTLSSSPVENHELVDILHEWAIGDISHAQSWYLWGETGVGKSGLAAGLVHMLTVERAKNNQGPVPVLFRPVPNLLSDIRATYNDEAQTTEADLLHQYTTVPVLILDDLGKEKPSEWVTERLYQIINDRHGAMLPTVFTSQMPPAQVAAQMNDKAIAWRIIEMCGGGQNVVKIEGRNLRNARP